MITKNKELNLISSNSNGVGYFDLFVNIYNVTTRGVYSNG
jgi:hypothetical protein